MAEQTGTLTIEAEDDILKARKSARNAAEALGFGMTDVTRIVTAVSELSRNIYLYAGSGEMRWQPIEKGGRSGLELIFDDEGPGIEDVEGALRGEFSTSEGMGRGITGTKQLMDEMDIETSPEHGTTITITMWL